MLRFVISALGGSTVQIAGPTAAFATIVAGIVAKSGTEGLFAATLLAGALLVLMGLLRLGSLIRYIPHTITTGFTAGIAVTIAIGQLKDFLGLTYPAGTVAVETMEKLAVAAANIGTLNLWALALGVLGILIQVVYDIDSAVEVWNRLAEQIIAFILNFLIQASLIIFREYVCP